jgi:hypothetical protein
MRVDLMELIARRPIVHPTRVERVIICGKRLEMLVSHPGGQTRPRMSDRRLR